MPSENFLKIYYIDNASKRLHKWIHYFDIYEQHFHQFRGKSPVVVEIGVFGGGSLEMWRKYFGDGCKIVGVDNNPECRDCEGDSVEILIGDQQDPKTIEELRSKYPRIDIVIDDGSHKSPHMTATFEMLYEHLDPNGVYLVEDTHACYWKEMGGGAKVPGSFMEFAKNKIDELHAAISRKQVPITAFTRSTRSINFYDSIVVFERRPQGQRHAPATAAMGTEGVF